MTVILWIFGFIGIFFTLPVFILFLCEHIGETRKRSDALKRQKNVIVTQKTPSPGSNIPTLFREKTEHDDEVARFAHEMILLDIKLKAEQGDAKAQCFLATAHLTGDGVDQDWSESVKWYRKAADQGHADAQAALGSMFLRAFNEEGVIEDRVQAGVWFRKAAKQGHAFAREAIAKYKL